MVVFAIMGFCFITQKELYPFAPYTMYSYPFTPERFREVRIFIGKRGGESIEITPLQRKFIYPFDEARVKESFEKEKRKNPAGNLDSPVARTKARELLLLINRNTGGNYDLISVGIYSFASLSDLRSGIKTRIEEINENI